MEIDQRMSNRLAWLLGIGVLVLIGLLLACGSSYNSASDGLLVVGSQGSGLLETFSFSLASGHVAEISNPVSDTSSVTCALKGQPSSLVLDPSGAFAYAIVDGNSSCGTADNSFSIQAFTVSSSGTIATSGSPVSLNAANVQICESVNGGPNTLVPQTGVPVSPVIMTIDSAGKYLFVADSFNSITVTINGAPTLLPAPGAISVFSVSGGSLTEVSGSPFTVPASCAAVADFSALAVTPTVFPGTGVNQIQNAVCSVTTPPTSEFLYVADKSNNNAVWQFAVNSSTGALAALATGSLPTSVPVGTTPLGLAVDPCNRFVYASNELTNNISAFTMCNGSATQSLSCSQPGNPLPAGTLVPVAGSPFSVSAGANGPGPSVVDPFGNYLYVIETLSNQVSPFKINQATGGLTSQSVAATGLQPTALAIRSDDNWLFVTNYNAATVSQYAVTPATGALSGQPVIQTDNYPSGIAVK